MSPVKVEVSPVEAKGRASASHVPGTPDLAKYPLLVYAPAQRNHKHAFDAKAPYDPEVHGAAVRVEDSGAAVSDIVEAAGPQPDTAALARRFQTTPEHIVQALEYHDLVIGRTKAKAEEKAETQPKSEGKWEAKSEAKPSPKAEPKPEAKAEAKPEAKKG